MDALILGNNKINSEVEKVLNAEGIGTVIHPDAAGIGKVNGFKPVIITQPPSYEAPLIGGEAVINLMDDAEAEKLLSKKTDEKIVVLLDFEEEAPEYIAAKAVSLAKKLAETKKETYFLSKVVKSGFAGGEEAFLNARKAGVTFIKYDKAAASYDEEEDRFFIEVNDGVFETKIDTPYVLSAVVREPEGLIGILKKLRLYRKTDGSAADIGINNDRFFLDPVFTSRYGIYYINPLYISCDNPEDLRKALFDIAGDIKAMSSREASRKPGGKWGSSSGKGDYVPELVRGLSLPEVDKGKCAFCYSCFRACPHGALEPDIEASAMKVVEALCQACGTCIAICPGEAIARSSGFMGGSARDSSPQQSSCKIYLCENGAADAYEEVFPLLGGYGKTIETECVACGGSVGADMLTRDAVNYDILIIACCVGDACRHMDGDKRACKQAERAAVLFEKAGLPGKRAEVIKVSHAMENVMRDNLLSILEERD